jgi:hypothetical protein
VAPVVQLGVQEVYVVEEHFHCDVPEQEQADRQVGDSEQQRVILMFLYHKKCLIKYGI